MAGDARPTQVCLLPHPPSTSLPSPLPAEKVLVKITLEESTQAQKSVPTIKIHIVFVPNRTSTSTSATKTTQCCAEMPLPSFYRREEKAKRNMSANKSSTAVVNATGFFTFVWNLKLTRMAFACAVRINACAIASTRSHTMNCPLVPSLNINRIMRSKRVLDEDVLRLSEIDWNHVGFCRQL